MYSNRFRCLSVHWTIGVMTRDYLSSLKGFAALDSLCCHGYSPELSFSFFFFLKIVADAAD